LSSEGFPWSEKEGEQLGELNFWPGMMLQEEILLHFLLSVMKRVRIFFDFSPANVQHFGNTQA
jgi:hypothetical protein